MKGTEQKHILKLLLLHSVLNEISMELAKYVDLEKRDKPVTFLFGGVAEYEININLNKCRK